MKQIFAILCLLVCGASVGAVSVIDHGASAYTIVVPAKATAPQKYAADQLQSFLLQITGTTLPIVSENRSGFGPAFYIGPTRKAIKAGAVEQAAKLKEDGVLIRTIGKDIMLAGQNERGTIYSVYVLLEKYLGVRFLAWDSIIVPKTSVVDLPYIDYAYAPPFMYREVLSFDAFPKGFAVKQRLNGPFTQCDASVGGKIAFYPYVHSFSKLLPPEEYYKEHPEYFGLQNGKRVAAEVHAQLCLTNPEVLKIATAKVLSWIKENPEVPIIDVSQNDGNGPCECENCMAVVREEGSQHGPILRFVNAIADEVAKEHPDKWVETLAYAYAMTPPAKTVPRDNVIIRLCHAGCYFHGFEECGLGANLTQYLEQWTKISSRVFIWHYGTNFAHYLAPNQNLSGLVKDIKYYGKHGLNGLMVQCNYQAQGGELAELRQYVASQLLWNPKLDAQTVIREFCEGYYPGASGKVLEFIDLMRLTAQDPDIHAFGAWDPAGTVTPDFLNSSIAILQEAKESASTKAARNHVDKLILPFRYMQLTYPDKYGVSKSEAREIWKQAKRTIRSNNITLYREGGGEIDPWIASVDRQLTPAPKNVVFDLMQIDKANTDNCLDWRLNSVLRKGKLVDSIFQHPKEGGSRATYTVKLPDPAGKKLLFKFGTVISNRSEDGVRFSVLVNDKEIWNLTQFTYLDPAESKSKPAQSSIMPDQPIFKDTELDLTAHAGKTITLTLRVDQLESNGYDWANWLEPRIIVE